MLSNPPFATIFHTLYHAQVASLRIIVKFPTVLYPDDWCLRKVDVVGVRVRVHRVKRLTTLEGHLFCSEISSDFMCLSSAQSLAAVFVE